jgi:hypothetical protein
MDPGSPQTPPGLGYDDLPPRSRIGCELTADELVITLRTRGVRDTFRKLWVPFLMIVLGVGVLPMTFVLLASVSSTPPGNRAAAWHAARVTTVFAISILALPLALFGAGWRRAELRLGPKRLVLSYHRFLQTRRFEWPREELVAARAVQRLSLERIQQLGPSPPTELHVELTGGRAVALGAAIPTALASGPPDPQDLEWIARRLNRHLNGTQPGNGQRPPGFLPERQEVVT